MPYGAGKAIVLGTAAYQTPNAALATLTYRCLDYLATTQSADFRLATSLASDVVQGVPIEAQAVVTAYGGGAVADAEVKIDLPAGAAVTRLVVDEVERNPQTNWTFVNVPSGAEHRTCHGR